MVGRDLFIRHLLEGRGVDAEYPPAGENTIIRNNIFSEWTRASICFYYKLGVCLTLPIELTASNNAAHDFEFVDIQNFDFHLAPNSPLIDVGYNLGSLNPFLVQSS
jgi:hypothetical protein